MKTEDYVVQFSRSEENLNLEEKVSATNAEGPPVPIPNTEVKLCSGENTLLEAARENSSMPTQRREQRNLLSALKKTSVNEKPH